jgi:phage FluMu protein Com
MPIEFHCEHCSHVIRAQNESAGKKGKCPRCQNVVYIPLPPEESGEIPLAPVNEEEERRAREEEARAKAVQQQLLRDRQITPERAGERRGISASPSAGRADPLSTTDPQQLVTAYASAMVEGRLEEADRLSAALSRDKSRAKAVIDAILAGDQPPKGLGNIPRPVLAGYLKRLRSVL